MVSRTFLLDVMKLHLSLYCEAIFYFESKERRVVYYVTGYGISNPVFLLYKAQIALDAGAPLTPLPTHSTPRIYRVRYCLYFWILLKRYSVGPREEMRLPQVYNWRTITTKHILN